jgi:hypothetical protein
VSFPAATYSMQLILVNPMNGTPSQPNHYPLNIKVDASVCNCTNFKIKINAHFHLLTLIVSKT